MDDPEVRVGVPPSRHGTIHTGASWMCAGEIFRRVEQPQNRSRLMPGPVCQTDTVGHCARSRRALVGPDSLLDCHIPDYEEPPAPHLRHLARLLVPIARVKKSGLSMKLPSSI